MKRFGLGFLERRIFPRIHHRKSILSPRRPLSMRLSCLSVAPTTSTCTSIRHIDLAHKKSERDSLITLSIKRPRSFSSSTKNDRSILFAALEDEIDEPIDSKPNDLSDNPSDTTGKRASNSESGDQSKHMFDSSKTSPLWHLKHYYLHQHGIVISTEEHFTAKMIMYRQRKTESVKTGWTASFHSPCVGYQFRSGTFRDDSKLPLRHENLPKNDIVYAKRSMAEHAAAAYALDFIQYRITGETEPRLCTEHPSNVAKRQAHDELVRNYYRRKKRTDALLRPTVKKLKDREDEGGVLYLATFVCPVSGREYHSTESSGALSDPGVIIDGRCYYNSKTRAKRAALTRFLDLNFGVHTEEDEVALPVVDTTASTAAQQNKDRKENLLDPKPPFIVQEEVEYSSEESCESSDDEDDDALSRQSVPFVFAGDNEDYEVIYEVDQFTASPAQQLLVDVKNDLPTRPMDLDAAMDMASCVGRIGGTKYGYGSPHRLKILPKDPPSYFLRAKSALKILAGAVQATPHNGGSKANVAASSILQRMWLSKDSKPDTECYTLYLKCFDQQEQLRIVNIAESLVTSMQLRGRYRKTGHRLPAPDQSTLNALIQLTAQLGGSTGRLCSHINDENFVPDRTSFLSVLSSAIYEPKVDGDAGGFDPEFAADCIQRMHDLAEELNDDTLVPDVQVYNAPLRWTGGPALWAESRPYARYIDWDDYEHLYRKQFRETSAPDDLALHQARLMEEWLEGMEKLGKTNNKVKPDIETYEAVIQAWLRTATREGLEKAETIVQNLFDGRAVSVEPRLETIHPILAARLYFIEQDSPSKVKEILDLWNSVVEKKSLQPDMRLVELELFILHALHSRAMNDGSKRFELHTSQTPKLKSPEDVKSDVLSAAMRCSTIVEDVQNNKDIPFAPEMNLLKSAVQMWKSVLKLEDEELSRKAVREVEKTIARVEDILNNGLRRDWNSGGPFTPRLAKNASPAVEHCLHQCHIVFFTCLQLLQEACEQRPHDVDLLRASLLLGEKVLRLIGEIELIERTELEEHGGDPWQTSFDYADRFKYRLHPKFFVTLKREQAMKPILRLLGQNVKSLSGTDELACDAIRISALWESIWPNHVRTKDFRAIVEQVAPTWLSQIEFDGRDLNDEVARGEQSALDGRSSNETTKRKRRRRRRRKLTTK